MRLFQPGDRSVGICQHCRCKVRTVMKYVDFTPAGTDAIVPDVLLGICERCDNVVGIPYQSTPKINEHRAAAAHTQENIEARVPRSLEEALELVTASVGGTHKEFRPAMMRYYLNQVSKDPEVARQVEARSKADLARGKADRRLALKVPSRQWAAAWTAAKAAGITRNSQLLRGVAALIADDYGISLKGKGGEGLPATKPSKGARARIAFLKDLVESI
ncbi:hypothetical protein EP7_004427 [Isosphaeraceae bacterium EP7]